MTRNTTFSLGPHSVRIETGDLAKQAHGSALLSCGKTVILATVVVGPVPAEDPGFLPLTVDYREKMAAVGRFPSGARRREGGPTDQEILAARLIDRSLRPLFEKSWKREIQVGVTVHSADPSTVEPGLLGILAASAALHLSPVPWRGPVAGVRVLLIDGAWAILPRPELREAAACDLVVAATGRGPTMLEGGGRECRESEVLAAMEQGRAAVLPALAALEALRAEAPAERIALSVAAASPETAAIVRTHSQALGKALSIPTKAERRSAVAEVKGGALTAAAGRSADQRVRLEEALDAEVVRLVRERVLNEGRRLDGRSLHEVRPISGRVGFLPSTHGSAVFTRGQTQALVTATLGSGQQEAQTEGLEGQSRSRFFLHYNFPGFSVGEVRVSRGPNRREVGHGALAERALAAVIPSKERFPFTVRLESDILESNGSSSMATVCGGTLALMDAGVPLAAPVAGVAMGLVVEGERGAVLTDILGDEDHFGDMDFKIAGTRNGITAIQMDNKIGAVPSELLRQALEGARSARVLILDAMSALLAEPRSAPAQSAPRTMTRRIARDLVGALIGPKGATIRGLQQECGVEMTVTDEGLVTVFAPDAESASRALGRVEDLVGMVELNRSYDGKVVQVRDYGALVRIFEHAEGLVHITEWSRERLDSFERAVRVGERVRVKVIGIDPKGRLKLSRIQAQ